MVIMQIFFICYGEMVWNCIKCIQGYIDILLVDIGFEQVQWLVVWFVREVCDGVWIDVVYLSDLMCV